MVTTPNTQLSCRNLSYKMILRLIVKADSSLRPRCRVRCGSVTRTSACCMHLVHPCSQVAAALSRKDRLPVRPATHLPFAVETMGGLSESAQQLLRELHHSVSTCATWRDADAIGAHLLDSIGIAVQRGSGLAIRTSMDREMRRVFGAEAA